MILVLLLVGGVLCSDPRIGTNHASGSGKDVPSGGTLSSLKADVVAAFDRIAASRSFRLLPGLSLDRILGSRQDTLDPTSGSGTAVTSGGTLSSLKADVVAAFDKIAASRSFRLLPGLSLDRIPGARPDTTNTVPRDGREFSLMEVYKRAEGIFKTHSLFWNLLPGVDLTVSESKEGDFSLGVTECKHKEESRTFKFGMRRMKLVLLPIMYKLGVITTLLTLLTVFALKGLTIGVLLLIMSSAGLVAKLKWAHHGYGGYAHPGKEVHVHVHGGGHHATYHPGVSHYDEWVREDRPLPPQHHVPPVVHRIPHHMESTASPWASYIGDQSL